MQKNQNCLIVFMVLLIVALPANGFTQNLLNGPQKIVIDIKRNILLVSNANSGDLIQIDSIGKQTYFINGENIVYPTYDNRNNSILITHYDANTWERVPLGNSQHR
jgi:hypothetical protein